MERSTLLGFKASLIYMPDSCHKTLSTTLIVMNPYDRPTVINMYSEDLRQPLYTWFDKLDITFMFEDSVRIPISETEFEETVPYKMLQPISKAKYLDITKDEAARSPPYSKLSVVLFFDAILVHNDETPLSNPPVLARV
mmetsp:Transcript_37488/g.54856  ORF Transcript_37488/g.54856 Transcript_37488/m.54856 type:complete len:139 (-) Transcript_37488:853-1269(-)